MTAIALVSDTAPGMSDSTGCPPIESGFPEQFNDEFPINDSPTTWEYCGFFPKEDVLIGLKACRREWRTPRTLPEPQQEVYEVLEEGLMYVLAQCKDTAELFFETSDGYISLGLVPDEDVQQTDWYREVAD